VAGRPVLAGGRLAYQAGPDKAPTVEVVDARTGAKLWSFAPRDPAKAKLTAFGLGPTLAFVAEQPKDHAERQVITAYQLSDGKPAWTFTPGKPKPSGGLVNLGDELLVEDDGLTWLDPRGAVAAKVGIKYWFILEARATADRVYALTDAGNQLAAIDRKTKKVVWTLPTHETDYSSVVYVGPAAIYSFAADELIEHDLETGGPTATYGVANLAVIGGSPEAAPAVITCDGRHLAGFDPSATDLPSETATITGTVTCRNCERGKPLGVSVAGTRAQADAKGHFTMKIQARGSYLPRVDLGEPHPGGGLAWVTVQPRNPIVFTGAGTYKVTLTIEEAVQDGE
jgi:outer membrane protein assembly factor BamB